MSDSIKTNERELAGKIAQWFNEHLKGGNYPFTSASCEAGIKVTGTTYFGDIIIWENRETNKAYSLIELKPPFGSNENLERFRKKAVELKIKIAYTWDFQNLNAYKVAKNKIELADSEPQSVLKNINDWKRGDVQATIKAYIYKICEELLSISEKGRFRKFKPEKHYFIKFLHETVHNLNPIYEDFIRKEHRKKGNREKINKYVVEQGIAFASDEDFYQLVANQSVYGLVNKIIFYLTIKRYFTELPDLFEEDEDLELSIKKAFNKASEKDWQAVFLESPIEEFGIPSEAHNILIDLFANLKIYNFGELPEDVIGELFEELIEPDSRKKLGQFFTKEELVDFIIGCVINEPDKIFCDPTCGSGTFLIRLYSRLKYLNRSFKHEDILSRIWGIDIGKFPAELSTINLFRQDIKNFENFPRILNRNIFDIIPELVFEFPPTSAGMNYIKSKINLPEFNFLIGNFPFIRQELLEKKIKGYKKELTKIIAIDYLFEYPGLFILKHNGITLNQIKELKDKNKDEQSRFIQNLIDKNYLEMRLSGQADIYAYIFIHASKLLASDGNMAIITSNSWLDAGYGNVLKEFLLDHFKIKMIVASWAEPWFEDAAVNTVFTVLEKCDNKKERDENKVKFVKLKRKLSEIIGRHDLILESIKHWEKVDTIARVINTAELKVKDVTSQIKSFENNDFRIRFIDQKILAAELQQKGELSKWGKYLRAPDVYFEIIEKCRDKLIPLSQIANVRFAIKTGINEFFYLQKTDHGTYKNSRNWEGEIEEEYLQPIIKSPKDSDKINIDTTKLKNLIFLCNKSKAELKKEKHLGALTYIEWGEKQKTKGDISWREVPSVQGRKCWWFIDIKEYSNFLWPKSFNDRFLIFENKSLFVADRLYEITLKNKKNHGLLKFILNSTVQHLFIEVNGRINLGEGALDNMTYEAENCEILSLKNLKIKSNSKLFERKIGSVFIDYKQNDRKELDTEILKALNLEPEKFLDRIYGGLGEMVQERLELPKMRQKQKKQKVKIAFDEIKQTVIEECIGKKLKKFPEAFYTVAETGYEYDYLEFDIYNSSGSNLIADCFIGQYIIKDETGQEILKTYEKSIAEFILLIAKPEVFRLKVPKEIKVIENVLFNYSNYLENLKDALETNANNKLHSWAEAEKMTNEILEEYNLLYPVI